MAVMAHRATVRCCADHDVIGIQVVCVDGYIGGNRKYERQSIVTTAIQMKVRIHTKDGSNTDNARGL